MSRDDRRKQIGQRGERLAADHLERHGYRVLERNFSNRFGELDLVAHGHETLVFCEVKTREVSADDPHPQPLESITHAKQRQVRRLAAIWLSERRRAPWAHAVRFDAIGVVLSRSGRILDLDHLEGAF